MLLKWLVGPRARLVTLILSARSIVERTLLAPHLPSILLLRLLRRLVELVALWWRTAPASTTSPTTHRRAVLLLEVVWRRTIHAGEVWLDARRGLVDGRGREFLSDHVLLIGWVVLKSITLLIHSLIDCKNN